MISLREQWADNWLPEVEHKGFRVERFRVGEPSVRMLLRPQEYVAPGVYTKLSHYGKLWMSNTQMEFRTNREFLLNAKGNVLIAGLGLGIVPTILCSRDQVSSVTVLEINPDLIDMMTPHLERPKLKIIQADVLEYIPGKRECYDSLWFDIWSSICLDNLDAIKVLNRRWSRSRWSRVGPRSSWCEEHLKDLKKQESRSPAHYWS